MSRTLTVGVDVGGTFVKYGIVRGNCLRMQRSFPTAGSADPQGLQEAIVETLRPLLREFEGKIEGIGVGIPGLVSHPEGVVDSCANLPGWRKVPLQAALRARLRLPVAVENDVNAMTFAEWKWGAGRGVSDLVCITLGTGVGGGLVLGGEMYRGWEGSAGEIGHLPLGEGGRRCSCGGVGCLERTVGNREILLWVRRQLAGGRRSRLLALAQGDPRRITPELIDAGCRAKDPLALEAWSRVGTYVGGALASVVNLLNPEKIVVGGGISKAGRWLFGPMRAALWERAMRGRARIPVVPARLGPSAGLIGAALLARERGRG